MRAEAFTHIDPCKDMLELKLQMTFQDSNGINKNSAIGLS